MANREALLNRAAELTRAIKEHQTSAREAAHERQQIVIQLADQERMSDAEIGRELGLTRQAVEAIRKGRAFGPGSSTAG